MKSHLKRLAVKCFPRLSKWFKLTVLIPYHSRRSSEIFRRIYHQNEWNDPSSRSGEGSSLEATEMLRNTLPGVLSDLKIDTLLDAPCGDFHWMQKCQLNLTRYFGGDIVDEIVEKNKELFESPNKTFIKIDITSDPFPDVQAIFCRDCLIHLSHFQIQKFFNNLKKSSIKYLLVTNQPLVKSNHDIAPGEWRALNLLLPPFNLPPPILKISDHRPGKFEDDFGKDLSVWEIKSL